jgi:hypothetical protein
MQNYTWIPVYREIAEAILPYENNQAGLIDLLKQVKSHGLPIIPLKDKNEQNQKFPIAELDLDCTLTTGQNRLGWADGFPPYSVVAVSMLHT